MSALATTPALLLIDIQTGFNDPPRPERSTPQFETNISRLISTFREEKHLIFHVAHHSTDPTSPFHPVNSPQGIHFQSYSLPIEGERVFVKNVNSAFIGTDLEATIRDAGVNELFIAGMTTDHCVSTSTRMAANLGVVGPKGKVFIVGDGTAAYEKGGFDAETVHRVNLASLDGEFADVVDTEEVVKRMIGSE